MLQNGEWIARDRELIVDMETGNNILKRDENTFEVQFAVNPKGIISFNKKDSPQSYKEIESLFKLVLREFGMLEVDKDENK